MRTKKRLRWVREEDTNIYRAKRKTESASIVPLPEGGYALVYRSQKCKRKAIVSTITDAKAVAEDLRTTKRNPLAMTRASKMMVVGVGLGAAAAVGVIWLLNKNAAAQTPPASPPPSPAPTPTPVKS